MEKILNVLPIGWDKMKQHWWQFVSQIKLEKSRTQSLMSHRFSSAFYSGVS